MAATNATVQPTDWKAAAMQKRIRGRYRAEKRFKFYGLAAVVLSAGFLAFLLFTMVSNGLRGFTQSEIAVPIDFAASDLFLEPAQLEGDGADAALAGGGGGRKGPALKWGALKARWNHTAILRAILSW